MSLQINWIEIQNAFNDFWHKLALSAITPNSRFAIVEWMKWTKMAFTDELSMRIKTKNFLIIFLKKTILKTKIILQIVLVIFLVIILKMFLQAFMTKCYKYFCRCINENISEDTSRDILERFSKDISENNSDDISADNSKDISRDILKDIS